MSTLPPQVHEGIEFFDAREAAAVVFGLAWQGHRPSDLWFETLTEAMLPRLPGLSGRTLAMLLASLCKIGYRPSKGWLSAFAAAARDKAGVMNEMDISSLSAACSLLDVEPM